MNELNKILLTGASGQLGQEFQSELRDTEFTLMTLTREHADISELEGLEKLSQIVKDFKPDILINCAAYTNVDGAEDEPALAESINANSLAYIENLSSEYSFKILHFSTDYVFDGSGETPWQETDDTFPINVYGLTKMAGEEILLESNSALIIRVSWLYSEYGTNFPKTINQLLQSKDELNIVNDQVSSPTWTKPLVKFVIQNLLCNADLFNGSLYHYADEGECSWYEMAEIINESYNKKINAVSSSEFIQKAKRPRYSKLDNRLAKMNLELESKNWEDNFREFLKLIQH